MTLRHLALAVSEDRDSVQPTTSLAASLNLVTTEGFH